MSKKQYLYEHKFQKKMFYVLFLLYKKRNICYNKNNKILKGERS